MPAREKQTKAGKHLWRKEAAEFKPRTVSTRAYSKLETRIPSGGTLLEIAPGNGEGLLKYMHKPAEIHLADISEESVDKVAGMAMNRNATGHVIDMIDTKKMQAQMKDSALSGKKFGTVICNDLLTMFNKETLSKAAKAHFGMVEKGGAYHFTVNYIDRAALERGSIPIPVGMNKAEVEQRIKGDPKLQGYDIRGGHAFSEQEAIDHFSKLLRVTRDQITVTPIGHKDKDAYHSIMPVLLVTAKKP